MSGRPSERHVIAYLAFMGILLAFGIDISLPALDEIRPAFGLGPDSNQVTLIITLYFLGMAGGQIIYGPFADRFGRAPVLRVGILIYALGAAGSTLAPNIELLFASRLVWGFGAAAPGVLRLAVARDLYQGNQMARVMSITMAFFLIGPILVPLVGEGILSLGSWRWVFAAALILAAVLFTWTFRFGETLDPANKRPLELGATLAALRLVLGTRSTMAYLAAMTFGSGAFILFLGSSQPIFD
ncbi:MAG: MFS transporter, partial [Acidimicrobiales bacterium]